MTKAQSKLSGFTIVELLVVIVVIGILASITVVSYTGVSNKAIVASLKSDLSGASKQLKMFNVEYGYYPTTISTNCATNPTNTTNLCLKQSPGNSFTSTPYSNPTPQSFILTAVNGANTYYITENSAPSVVVAVSATGGTITYTDSNGINPRSSPAYPGGYTVHTFTTSGSLTVTGTINNASVLIVGGGGGGSGSYSGYSGGGGGGAGGYLTGVLDLTGSMPATVGLGGNGGPIGASADGFNGNSSIFSTFTAIGGGGGGVWNTLGKNGGSGGGAYANGGSGTAGQGSNGGTKFTGWSSAGGGGGAGGVGGNALSGGTGGTGGIGISNTISGLSISYAGGGGGGSYGATGGTASYGGGAGGGNPSSNGINGTTNTGGGGGGGGNMGAGTGGIGGSGIVIIRYPTP